MFLQIIIIIKKKFIQVYPPLQKLFLTSVFTSATQRKQIRLIGKLSKCLSSLSDTDDIDSVNISQRKRGTSEIQRACRKFKLLFYYTRSCLSNLVCVALTVVSCTIKTLKQTRLLRKNEFLCSIICFGKLSTFT